jgi:hypothetical protein
MCRRLVDSSTPLLTSILLALLLLAGCALLRRGPAIGEPIKLIAVLPIERHEPADVPDSPASQRLLPGAENVVAAQIYGVLSGSPEWRFVPDLTVAQGLAKVPGTGDLVSRARALGKAVDADAVLCGTVYRYMERVGSEYGARQPASVSLTLQLVSVATGEVLWSAKFDQQQQSLAANLFNWWQFWKGGPRWFTAQEFTRLGVERLLGELADQLGY